MKTIHSIYMIAVLASASFAGAAQDYPDEYLGLPGDNLNLYAVMNLFQESETLEGFERSLNDNEAVINNLDLNGDQLIDYIAVSDFKKENVHTIVLRTALNRNEEQDIAVFVVEKLRNGAVQIQLIGDEALYGRNYIVEPIYAETPNPGYNGTIHSRNANVVNTSSYDIGAWPVVRYIYAPRYRVWRSSWYWGYYPTYWRPWRPHYWHYYYGYHNQWHNHYYSHYRHWDHYRCRKYKTYYHSHVRVHSPTVVVNINQNRYRSTYSRPDQRRAGEKYYTSSASRSNRSSTVQRSQPSQNRSAVQRSSSSRSSSTRSTPAVKRSNSTRSTPAVKRSSSNKSTPAVQPKSSSRSSSSRSTPAVKRSTSTKKSSSAVKRSNGSTNSRSSSVQRSQSGKSKSKSSAPRSSSSSRKSSSSKGRSSSSRR